jgi:hypothetical protein
MRRIIVLSVAAMLSATLALAGRFYRIVLTGDAQVFSIDRPTQRGAIYVFHRYPDGVFSSIPVRDVVRVREISAVPGKSGLSPGETLVLGPTGSTQPATGKTSQRTASSEESSPPEYGGMNPAYFGYYGYATPGYSFRIGRRHNAPPPSTVGPNGFPTLGWTPPAIGTDGFPELAPPRKSH